MRKEGLGGGEEGGIDGEEERGEGRGRAGGGKYQDKIDGAFRQSEQSCQLLLRIHLNLRA